MKTTQNTHSRFHKRNCPICDSSNPINCYVKADPTMVYEIYGEIDLNGYQFKLAKCRNCKLFYHEFVFTEETEQEMLEIEDNLFDEDVDIWVREMTILKYFHKKETPTLLDVGSHLGGFSIRANHMFVISSYEKSMRKYDVHKKLGLNILDKIEGKFDIIRLSNVFTHVHNGVMDLLTSIRASMSDDGILMIVDWNGNGIVQNDIPYYCWRPLWHVNILTEETIQYLADILELDLFYLEYEHVAYENSHFRILMRNKNGKK